MLNYTEALKLVCDSARVSDLDDVVLKKAFGYVIGEAVVSDRCIPISDNSAMDGYGFIWEECDSTLELKVIGHISAGDTRKHTGLNRGQCYRIMTGASVPASVDTVVPREKVVGDGEALICLKELPKRGANIRRAGEDIAVGDVLDMRGRPLGPGDLGVLASVGCTHVKVHRAPTVAYFSTGEELIDPDEELVTGKVVNSNAWSLEACIRLAGGFPLSLGKAGDSLEETMAVFEKAKDCDIILSTGGVSMGDHDHVKEAMEAVGMDIKFWKVAIKPGKPLAFATWGKTVVFGLPGNPVSCLVNFELFVKPAIRKFRGYKQYHTPTFSVTLEEDFPIAKNKLHLVRAVITYDKNKGYHAIVAGSQGSGVLRSMSLANALVFVDKPMSMGEKAQALWLTGKELWL